MDVFFLFPGRVFDCFCLSLGSEQTKNPTGQKSFVCFGTFRGDTEFRVRVSILFLIVFQRAKAAVRARNIGRAPVMARGPSAIRESPGALLFALRTLFR